VTRNDDERIAGIQATTQLARPVGRGRAAFDTDTAVRFAIERFLEIIGEASNAMSTDSRDRYPGVNWTDITRLRIVLAHHYHRVDPDQVWSIASDDVPRLGSTLRASGS